MPSIADLLGHKEAQGQGSDAFRSVACSFFVLGFVYPAKQSEHTARWGVQPSAGGTIADARGVVAGEAEVFTRAHTHYCTYQVE